MAFIVVRVASPVIFQMPSYSDKKQAVVLAGILAEHKFGSEGFLTPHLEVLAGFSKRNEYPNTLDTAGIICGFRPRHQKKVLIKNSFLQMVIQTLSPA